MTLEDAILEKVRGLPLEKQEEVLRFAESLRPPVTVQSPYRDRSREIEWFTKNRHNPDYMDQWVVIEGATIVAAGTDARKVYDEAKAKGVEVPFVVHIVPEDPLPWGGW
jgi:hypothetical protein